MKSSKYASGRRSVVSAVAKAVQFETLELRRMLAAQVFDSVELADLPHDRRGSLVGNYVHEYEHATGEEHFSSMTDPAADDLGILNQSLQRAGFNGMPDLINALGDSKDFVQRLEDTKDNTLNSVFGTDDRFQIFAGTTFPWRSIVRIGTNDGNYRGTGAMISPYHVLTAGHVVHSGAGGNWINTLQVSPGQTDVNTRPYGTPDWTWVRSYTNWTNSSDANWDWAVITLDRRIGNFTGWMGQEWNSNTNAYNGTTVNLAGYPSDKAIGTMWGAAGPINNGNGGQQFFYNGTLDTAPGHSGSPVWRFDGTNRNIVGVHAYGDGGDGFNRATRMTQQKFNDTGAWVNEDNGVRPPTDRPDLLDYDDWFNTNTSSVSPGSVQQGGGINASFNLRNNGTASASNAVIRFYASTNTTISSSDILLGQGVWNLSALGTFNVAFNGTVPASTPVGSYYIGWIIDATNTNTEYLEGNNTGYHNTPINVTAQVVQDFMEPNDSFASARNLATLVDATYSGLNIHTSGNDDYFRFTAADSGPFTLSLSFTHSLGDIDVSLMNSSGTVLTSSTSTGNSELINWPVTRGQSYTVRVYGYQGATNPSYTMSLDGPEILVDQYEPNNDFGSPWDFGPITQLATQDLSIHASGNADFYRFISPGDGPAAAAITFAHIDGDVDMALYTDTGTFITSSTGTGNSEQVSFNASAGSAYVLQVYGYAGAVNWLYDLFINAPQDTVAPTIDSDEFAFDTAPHELRFTFSENVFASIDPTDLILQNLATGGTVPSGNIAMNYDFGSNTAIFTFPSYNNGVLPQGAYSATILAGTVEDVAGNPLAANHNKTFNFFLGDTDGNGLINFDDYAHIDLGFNQGFTGFSNGDFNYDGVVNFDDYAIIDLAFNTQ